MNIILNQITMADNKIFFLIILFLFSSVFTGNLISDQSVNETELFVIGTVHESTEAFNSDTLLNILNEIKPDVILVECDSSYLTRDFRFKEDVEYAFLETSAITEYLKVRSAVLRPYDISGRDEFLDNIIWKKTESDFFYDIVYMYETGKYNTESANIYERNYSLVKIAEDMTFSKASYINSPAGSSYIDTINYYTYDGLRKLIDITPELEKYKPYSDRVCSYWEKRNKTMIKNIIKVIEFYEGKKIVVLCGFAHKNILLNGINESVNKKIVLKDFWKN